MDWEGGWKAREGQRELRPNVVTERETPTGGLVEEQEAGRGVQGSLEGLA